MKKVVVLLGSPRKNGNTELLVNSFLDGIDKEKCDTEVISVVGKKVHGCIGCDHCKKTEACECAFKDDMQEIYARLAQADTIVIATPIYFYNVSSQLKSIIDRLHNPIRNTFRVKSLALLAVCADTIPTVFDSTIMAYKSTTSYFSLKDMGIVTASGVSEKGDIVGHIALNEARELAIKISNAQ